MSEPFIWKLSAIWLWKETTSWTAVAPSVWISKTAWVLTPSFEVATDNSGYWVIDENFDTITTKNFSTLNLQGIVRDDFIGYLFLGALGKYTPLKVFTGTVTGWTPARWDTVTGWTLKKIWTVWTTTYYFFDGTVSAWTITNGTWSLSATEVTSFKAHMFERKNSNKPVSFTLYGDDPVACAKAPYSVVTNLEINCEVADYVKFTCGFQGKKMEDVTPGTYTPAYADEIPFTASMAWVRVANDESGLNSATEVCMQSFRLAINKNIADMQCFWDTDVSAFYNQQLGIEGDFEAMYSDTDLRDYVINSAKKAIRFYVANTENGLSAIVVDIMKAWLNSWTESDSNEELIRQTVWYTALYDNNAWTSIEILLINQNSVGY